MVNRWRGKEKEKQTLRKKIIEEQSSANDDTDNSKPAKKVLPCWLETLLIKNIQATHLGKAVGHQAMVKSLFGATNKDIKDYLKPNLEVSPDQVILHAGNSDLKQKDHNKLRPVCRSRRTNRKLIRIHSNYIRARVMQEETDSTKP